MQLWKHDSAVSHTESARQFSVSRQQLPTMHMLQGVPPGLRVQVPPSTGNPQSPLSQVSPLQHCWAVLQFDPMGRHDCVPHTPLWQTPEQHWLAAVQADPSMAQVGREQNPFRHSPPQHWLFVAHVSPLARHIPQIPWPLQTWLQHSASASQGEPSEAQLAQIPLLPVVKLQEKEQQSPSDVHRSPRGRQVPAWQTPARQVPLQQGYAPCPQKSPFSVQLPLPQRFEKQEPVQHSAALAQGEPSGTHIEALHAPLLQTDEQHSADEVQTAPSPRQAWVRQVPASQMPLQQSASNPQSAPAAAQENSPQVPWEQAPLQHCEAVWQRKPSGWQALPQKPPEQGRPLQQWKEEMQTAP